MANSTVSHAIYAFLLLDCTLLLSGCFPLMGHYYSASTPGGTVSQQDCRGRAGPMTNVEFERGDVKLLVLPYQHSSSLTLTVQFRLNSNDRMVTQWNELKVVDDAGNRLPIEIKGIYAHKAGAPITLSSNIESISGDTLTGQDYSLYEVEVQFVNDAPDDFIFIIPSMTINGVSYADTNITFNRQFGWWVQFTNC